jgi:hypothetical protein
VTNKNAASKPRFTISRKVLIQSGVAVLAVAALVTLSINTVRLNSEVEEGNTKLATASAQAKEANDQVEELKTNAELMAERLRLTREARDGYVVREAELQAKEKAVTDRETAITATETVVQESTLKDGKYYTVGTSMQAGSYQANSASTSCYWSITESGTNYSDIVDNDLGAMGVLSVSVAGGQDFQSHDCGDWAKVG